MVPFTGPGAKSAEAVVVRALRRRAKLIPPSKWTASAHKLFARSHSADDISAVASDVGAQVVITGVVKRAGRGWELAVSVHDGQSGHARDRLHYPLRGPRVDRKVLSLLGVEVLAAFTHTLGTLSPSAAQEAPPSSQSKVAPLDEQPSTQAQPASAKVAQADEDQDEQPPLSSSAPARAPATMTVKSAPEPLRPRWAPYFELTAGAALSGRSWDFKLPTLPRFASGVVGGLRVDATLYPLAFLWDHAHGAFAGLGIGGTLDKPFWPASTPPAPDTNKYPTSELRVEGGLRWRFVLYKPIPRPELVLLAGGGLHQFTITKRIDPVTMNPADVGPPDVGYTYVTLGLGLRIHFAEWALLRAAFNYHLVTKAGPATTPDEYGPASTYGLRVQGGLDFFVWRGLEIVATGYYERFHLSFTGSDPPPALPADGTPAVSATDQYFGGSLGLGYVY